MANLPRKRSQANTSSPLQPVSLENGTLRVDVLLSMYKALQDILSKLAGRISLGQVLPGYHTGDLDGQFVGWTTVKEAPIAVPHGLGRIPTGWVVVSIDGFEVIYRDTTHPWTTELAWFTATSGGFHVMVFLF
jgi:hypothetical protein